MTLSASRPGADLDAARALERDLGLNGVWRRSAAEAHLDRPSDAIDLLRPETPRLIRWGEHLIAELVGKMREDRMALSALALTVETSSVTAIGNDYGYHGCSPARSRPTAAPATC